LSISAVGLSAGGNVTAEAVVFNSFDEMAGQNVQGVFHDSPDL
jgi:hypothetical protein